jgi:hypothetical protein
VGYVVANAKRTELHPEIRKAGVHVQTVLDRLGSFEALNVSPDGGYPAEVVNESIDFTTVFTQPQVEPDALWTRNARSSDLRPA